MIGGVLRSAQNDIACDGFTMKCDVALSVSEGSLAWPVGFFAPLRSTLCMMSSLMKCDVALSVSEGSLAWPVGFFAPLRTTLRVMSSQ